MQLKSINLKNIRSYSSFDVSFQSGSTLLSGDIGCGKTTILLSIEFALFGLMKGMLAGSSLLRHGEKEGSVTLCFLAGTDRIVISRSLRRTSSGIAQDSGYLEINGDKKEFTAVELKAKILGILGYPDELLTKSKSLIYRYTVYTPQEDMKKIIFDSEEDRLEKLTKIFNIEKYKRIRENADIYARELRAETKILPSLESELSALNEKQKKCEADMEDKNISLQKIAADVALQEKILIHSEEKIKSVTETVNALSVVKQELHILSVEKNNLLRNSAGIKTDIESLEQQKKRMSDSLNEAKEENPEQKQRTREEIDADARKFRELREKTEQQIIDGKSRIMSIDKKISESDKMKQEISSLTECPICRQDVNEEHKKHISDDENRKISDLKEKRVQAAEFVQKAETNRKIVDKKIELLESELFDIKSSEQKLRLRSQHEMLLRESDEKIIRLKDKLKTIDEDLSSNISLTAKLNDKISEMQIDEKAVQEVNAEYRKAKETHLALKMKEAGITSSISETMKAIDGTASEQERKKIQIEQVKNKKALEHWLSNHFISLVEIIEKNVLSSIRAEFKEHFEEWFNMLIEDESITATLDERFTPIITQNGYDTELENLSGGEKTSVALAYRLALNKVINSMISTIRTKDLLILDEPTDGFSSHQLDKVRDVLEALGCKQTIIVSHESKMESFVDHIIKLRKHEHESEITV